VCAVKAKTGGLHSHGEKKNLQTGNKRVSKKGWGGAPHAKPEKDKGGKGSRETRPSAGIKTVQKTPSIETPRKIRRANPPPPLGKKRRTHFTKKGPGQIAEERTPQKVKSFGDAKKK